MLHKKLLSFSVGLLIVSVAPWQVFAEDSTTPETTPAVTAVSVSTTPAITKSEDSGSNNKGKGKSMLLFRLSGTPAAPRPLPTIRMGKMEDQLKLLEQKVRLKGQTYELRLRGLHDEKKKTGLLSLDAKIASLSGRATISMTDAINRMTVVLNSISDKDALAKQQGADTTKLDAAIVEAKAALASASAAVTAQSAKVYTIPVTTDADAQAGAGQTVKALQNDLRQTRQSVMNAKQAIMKALMELKKVWHELKPTGTVTMTGTITPSVSVPTVTVNPSVTMEPEMTGMEMQQ